MKGRIITRFDERKTAAAAGVLLRRAGGPMPYLRLIKLLYLADRESWCKFHRPITGDEYVSLDHGPVLSHTYDLIRMEDWPSEGPWAALIESVPRYDVRLKGEPSLGPLSDAEIEILERVYDINEHLDKWKLRDFTHTLPEWKDPQGSALPIRPEEILRALDKSDEEIDEARQEAAERLYFDELFGTA